MDGHAAERAWTRLVGHIARVVAVSGSSVQNLSCTADAGKTAAVFYGGARLFETILPAGSSCISIYNGKTAYFCDGTVFLCDSTGAVTGKASARADVSGLCVAQNGVLVLSPNALTRLSFSDFS